jgi:hypothetical protein
MITLKRVAQASELLQNLPNSTEMAAAVKPSEQPRTESRVASGNGRCEA